MTANRQQRSKRRLLYEVYAVTDVATLYSASQGVMNLVEYLCTMQILFVCSNSYNNGRVTSPIQDYDQNSLPFTAINSGRSYAH